jgi:hypothetical protein
LTADDFEERLAALEAAVAALPPGSADRFNAKGRVRAARNARRNSLRELEQAERAMRSGDGRLLL